MENIKELIKKYQEGKATPEECAIVERHFLLTMENRPIPENEAYKQEIYNNLDRQYGLRDHRSNFFKRLSPLVKYAAAAVILLAGTGLFFLLRQSQETPTEMAYQTDVAPGGNRAYLTLADGKRIELTGAANGTLAKEAGVKIAKTADGQLVYTIATQEETTPTLEYNTIETPKGGQYQVHLPDGTKVWLNAASSLTYPASFASAPERRVELTGEAYFEVAHNKALPFRVKTANQVVEVVGTHFNVNSYADEPLEKTTLIEGAVKVISGSDNELLDPGEEAAVNRGIQISVADTEAALAWKNGMFVFNDEPLESIMRKVARWYNVEIVYQGVDKNELYGGSFSRYENVSGVLKNLEYTGGIQFKIEGRRITAIK